MKADSIIPIHRAGWPFIGIAALAAAALFALAQPLGWAGVVVTLWVVWFFRDPTRVTPLRDGLIVSPADGRVLPVTQAPPPPELGMGEEARTRISIFMSVFDVHVNRAVCDGTVEALAYRPGRFFNASLDKASEHNERMASRIRLDGAGADGADLAVVQIAGLVARRIKCYLNEGQRLAAGERFGIIRFGSRVDVYLPPGVNALVAEGQRTIAGETVLADRRAQEPERQGTIR